MIIIFFGFFILTNSPLYHPLKKKKALITSAIKAFNLSLVPTKGIEPSHPCEWQILSLLRLPIPPHGHFKIYQSYIDICSGCNITLII